MREFSDGFKGVWKTFIKEIKDYHTLFQKLASYVIVVCMLKSFSSFSAIEEFKVSYWLFVALMYLTGFSISFIALKIKWSGYISGVLKEFGQIVFTGLGILFVGLIMSGHFMAALLFHIFVLAVFTKFYLAMFIYFENESKIKSNSLV